MRSDYGSYVTEIRRQLLIANTSKVLGVAVGLVQKPEIKEREFFGRKTLGKCPGSDSILVALIHIKTLAAILYQTDGHYGVTAKLGGFIACQVSQFGRYFFR